MLGFIVGTLSKLRFRNRPKLVNPDSGFLKLQTARGQQQNVDNNGFAI